MSLIKFRLYPFYRISNGKGKGNNKMCEILVSNGSQDLIAKINHNGISLYETDLDIEEIDLYWLEDYAENVKVLAYTSIEDFKRWAKDDELSKLLECLDQVLSYGEAIYKRLFGKNHEQYAEDIHNLRNGCQDYIIENYLDVDGVQDFLKCWKVEEENEEDIRYYHLFRY